MAKDTKGKVPAAEVAAGAEPQRKEAAPRTVRVVAKAVGFYANERKKPGGKPFDMKLSEGQSLPSWVEPAPRSDAPTPARGKAPPPPPPGTSLGAADTLSEMADENAKSAGRYDEHVI